MSNQQRDIETLLVDYAGALRDGTIPVFLKSLSREEAQTIADSRNFPDAAEMVRLLNEAHFSRRAARPDVGLFISRVDAEIAARVKQARGASSRRTARRSQASQQR